MGRSWVVVGTLGAALAGMLACGGMGSGGPAVDVADIDVPDVADIDAPDNDVPDDDVPDDDVPDDDVPEAAPKPELSTPGALLPWQKPFAGRSNRDVRDYFMLMPDDLFHCDAVELKAYNEAERDAKITKRHVEQGYIEVSTGVGKTQIALFKDRKNNRDVVGRVTNCGPGCMCDETVFAVFGEDRFKAVDVVPTAAIESALRGKDHLGWWLLLPIEGTTTPVVDANGTKLLALKWVDGAFHLQP